jgi:hypothetical protein
MNVNHILVEINSCYGLPGCDSVEERYRFFREVKKNAGTLVSSSKPSPPHFTVTPEVVS